MRTCLIFAWFSIRLCAQFAELASTDDGRQMYFTSTLQFSGGAPSSGEPRVYRIAESGLIELFDSRAARSPQVSGDGRTVGLAIGGSGELRGLRTSVLGLGTLSMSRNARWAVLTGGNGPPPANSPPQSVLVNIETSERTTLPSPAGARRIASDGTVFIQGAGGIGLWRQGKFTPLTLLGPFGVFAISDDARVLVYTQISDFLLNPQQRLVARDLVTGTETIIFSRPSMPGQVAPTGLSNDGQWLLYRVTDESNAGPAFLANTTTGRTVAVPSVDGELYTDGVLSGYGNLAFLVTATGRLVSVDIANGLTVKTLVGPTAYVPRFPTLLPGSLARLTGILPRTKSAFTGRILLNDVEVPVVFVNDKEMGIQVPWEIKNPGPATFRWESDGPSPFRQVEQVQIRTMLPVFEPLAAGETGLFRFKAIRGDFSGLLTSNPRPGDVIVIYATGLGPLIGSVQTGQPAPLDRAIAIQGQFRCRFKPYSQDAETLFAGLAPSLTGIYQINLRLPSGPDPGPITEGVCTWSGSGIEGGFNFFVPVKP